MKTVYVTSNEYDDSQRVIRHDGRAWQVVSTTYPHKIGDPCKISAVPLTKISDVSWDAAEAISFEAHEVDLLSDAEVNDARAAAR